MLSPQLINFKNSLNIARKELANNDLQVPMLLILLDIASREETPMRDLERNVSLSQGAISRNITKLGRGFVGCKGLGLVEAFEDPITRRRKIVKLTDKGHRVINCLALL